jgi:hypothetical protein
MTDPGRHARLAAFAAASLLACGLAQSGAAAPEAEPLRAEDFAIGRTISTDTSEALQSVILDLDVYRKSVEPELADLRVFNAAGEAVPHAIRHFIPAPDPEPVIEPLPVFLLGPVAPSPADATGYSIDAEVSESGAILRLHSTRRPLLGPATSGSWLVDASTLAGESIVGLELELAPSAGDFIGYLRISASDDLVRFRTRTQRAAVARLTHGGHGIERLDLPLPSTRAKYLKLELIEGVLAADIRGVGARLATGPAPAERHRTRVDGHAVDAEPGHYVYDLGAHPPIDRIDILLDEPNTLLEVVIESAPERSGPWSLRHTGLVYQLEHDGSLRSPAIVWRGGDHRYLRLRIAPKGGGHLIVAPEIELAWRPEQLLFITRGQPPFRLAYGKRGAPEAAFSAARLVGIAGTEAHSLDEASATIGSPHSLAGEAAFEEPSVPIHWRQVGLWAVLLVAVGVVLTLSVRLLKQASGEAGEISDH